MRCADFTPTPGRRAGHRDLDQARARLALDLDVGQFVLGLLEVVLHRLRLLHQAGELVLHHDGLLLERNRFRRA
jgi:hypothetical protein